MRHPRLLRLAFAFFVTSLCACTGAAHPDAATDSAADITRVDAPSDTSDAMRACNTDNDCDDHVFCNGVEHCMPGATGAAANGCVPPSQPACVASQVCSESMQRCQTQCEVEADADHDGHMSTTCGGDDCDDADANRFPGNAEVCDTTGHDEDCDTSTIGARDIDGDAYVDRLCCNTDMDGTRHCGDDCNDARRDINPNSAEVCDGVDNNCNDTIDEGAMVAGFRDADHDGFGDDAMPLMQCPGSSNFSTVGGDCDDTTAARHTGLSEACDGIDNDCNGMVDDHTTVVNWYLDADGDGFGNASTVVRSCAQPTTGTYVLVAFDCDDTHSTVNPAAPEVCDGLDDDCNGRADFVIAGTDTEDDDQDGHGDSRCGGDDCNDVDSTTFTGATELCDARDNNCNSMVDEGTSIVAWYVDADRDGDGDAQSTAVMSCPPVPNRVRTHGDCNDTDRRIFTGAVELCDGVDQNCDGSVAGEDIDRDGQLAIGATCVGGPRGLGPATDCDDTNPNVRVGARELCDGIDQNCDAVIDSADPEASAACDAPHAQGTCTASNTCTIVCDAGYSNCTMNPGCETATVHDPSNCGTCGNPCGTGLCVNGACRIATPNKYVFVTGFVSANMGGLAGADAICQQAAAFSGLPGTYRAFLGTSTITAASRLSHSVTPYVRVDGVVVATNWTDLTDGTLAAPIERTNTNVLARGEMWTASTPTGGLYVIDCAGWTSASATDTGGVGNSSATNSSWATVYAQFCNRSNVGIYCMQQ